MLFFVMVLKPCTPRQGKTKVEVAKMIQATKDDVVIKYNKLHADPKQGDTHCTFKEKNSTWCCLKYPSLSCCSTRQNAGSHPEEGETQDGWQIQLQIFKYRCKYKKYHPLYGKRHTCLFFYKHVWLFPHTFVFGKCLIKATHVWFL